MLRMSVIALAVCFAVLAHAGTVFTYQGRLAQGELPAAGPHDFAFALFDAATDGAQVGETVERPGVPVLNGLFAASLDFGAGAFPGDDRWLEIRVRQAGGEGYSTLAPRQPLTPTPYALFAQQAPWAGITGRPADFGVYQAGGGLTLAGNTFSVADGAVTSTHLVSDAASLAKVTAGGMAMSNGKVGIGTSTPGFPLNFANVLGDKIALYGNSGNHYGFGIQGNLLQIHSDGAGTDVAFGYGSSAAFTETMRVKGNGNVGIGTSTPGAKLEVNGKVKVTAGISIGPDASSGPLFQVHGYAYTPAGIQQLSAKSSYYRNSSTAAGPWQSFTPTADTTLKALEVLLAPEDTDTSVQLKVHSGEGNEGAVLASQVVTVERGYGFHFFALSTPVPLTAGVKYTFAFSGLDCPTRVYVDSSNPYAGGKTGIFGSDSYDLCFRLFSTCTETGIAALMVDRSTLNVGIGTNSPGFPLNFANVLGDKIALHGQSGNHYGFGIQDYLLQIHTDKSNADIAFGHGSSANFTETMRIKGTGNVGIGTAAPGAKLDVNGTVKATGFQLGSTATAGQVLTTNATGVGTWQALPAYPTTLPPTGAAGGDLAGAYPNPTIGAGKVTNAALARAAASLARVSGGIMTASTGGVGIGTGAPKGRLLSICAVGATPMGVEHLAHSTSYRSGQQPWQSFTAPADTTLAAIEVLLAPDNATAGTLTIYAGEGTTGAVLATQPISMEAGYGYTTFVLTTPVALTAGAKYTFALSGFSGWLRVYLDNDYPGGVAWYGGGGAYDMVFRLFSAVGTSAAPALLVDNHTRNVGLGTETPGFPLTFANTLGDKISLFGQSGNHYGFGIQSNLLQVHTSASSADIAFGYGSSASMTETMRIKGNGNVGIGTSAPGYKLHVNGSVAGTSAYQNLSDGRLKTSVATLNNALDTVTHLRGVTFTWDKTACAGLAVDDRQHVGFIAQEVQQVLPQVVSTAPDGRLSLAYGDVVPVLVEAIKAQQAQIADLKARLAALEAKQ